MNELLTLVSIAIGLYAGWRMLRRSLRAGWQRVMSFRGAVPVIATNEREQRSHAMEQPWEQPGTGVLEHVPSLAEQLESLSDDGLLDILAGVRTPEGDYRFAESRIGRFVGGRLEDRIAQVRAARGAPEPEQPPGRVIRMKDATGERMVAWDRPAAN